MRHRNCKSGDSQFTFILGKFLEVMGFQEASPISPSPHSPALTTPRGGSRLCDQKALGAIVSGEGKALDKAEFKVDYKSLSSWASVPHLLLLQMTAETKAPEPGVWAEFSSYNCTADVWGRATVSAVGDSLCSCTKTHHLQTC